MEYFKDNHRILIIEDDEIVLDSLKYIFSKKGYNVMTAADGKTGIQIFKENNIDVVITDIKIQGMDGFDVIKGLQCIDPDIPIIVFTGYNTAKNRARALKIGAFHYLTKPCDNKVIVATVKKAIDYRKFSIQKM